MKIKIEKTIDEKGRIQILINNSEPSLCLSRKLTGTDESDFTGIFNVNTNPTSRVFVFGEYSKQIQLLSTSKELTVDQLAENLKTNIERVRDWVKTCKAQAATSSIEFEIED